MAPTSTVAVLRGVEDPALEYRRVACSMCQQPTWVPGRGPRTRIDGGQLFLEAVVCPKCRTQVEISALERGYGIGGPAAAAPAPNGGSTPAAALPPVAPLRPSFWGSRRERRALRRTRRLQRKSLRRRVKDGARTLDVLIRTEQGTPEWAEKVVASWRTWDADEEARMRAAQLDSLRAVYPARTEEELNELLARFERPEVR